jgi:hypothetical protein
LTIECVGVLADEGCDESSVSADHLCSLVLGEVVVRVTHESIVPPTSDIPDPRRAADGCVTYLRFIHVHQVRGPTQLIQLANVGIDGPTRQLSGTKLAGQP